MSLTTIEQKCAGGAWLIRAAVAEDTPSAELESLTIRV